MHILIVGARGVGKSTLIRRVLKELNVSVCGFETKKEDHLEDPEYGSPVYIYEADKPHEQHPENLVGYCKNKHPLVYKETFDRYAQTLREVPETPEVILMDEIGFMESLSEEFQSAILSHLEGDRLVIAAVKHKDTPFLQQVRSHPNCRCFTITPENRDALKEEVCAYAQTQLKK